MTRNYPFILLFSYPKSFFFFLSSFFRIQPGTQHHPNRGLDERDPGMAEARGQDRNVRDKMVAGGQSRGRAHEERDGEQRRGRGWHLRGELGAKGVGRRSYARCSILLRNMHHLV